jgi:hypothetical protein
MQELIESLKSEIKIQSEKIENLNSDDRGPDGSVHEFWKF